MEVFTGGTKEQDNKPVTTLFIKQVEPFLTIQNGRHMALPSIKIARRFPDMAMDLVDLHDLHNTVNLHVVWVGINGASEIALPQQILDKMAEYLRKTKDEKQEFDCGKFIHHLFNVPYRFSVEQGGGVPLTEDWNLALMQSERDLEIGDAVTFAKEKGGTASLEHFALYIGNGSFLSQSGNGGQIIVGDIFNMEQIYDTNTLYKITPKKL